MNDFVELRKVISIIARRWWLLVLLTVVMAAGGFVYSQRQTKVYQGSVTLLVGTLLQRSQVERNDILVSEMLAQTYADLARRQPVLQGAIDTLELQSTWTSLRSRITVSLIEETQLLQIKVQAASPDEAQLIADAVAHQLILLSPTVLEEAEQTSDQVFISERLENLRGKIETGQSRLEELETRETLEVNTLTPDELKDLRKEIETLEGLIADWEKSYSEFLAYSSGEQAPNSLTIIEPAHASSRPIKPRPMVNTLIAAAVGFGLALAIVFVLEFLDDTLKSTDELTEALDLTAPLMGKHDKNGILIAAGAGIRSGHTQNAKLIDTPPTILYYLGLDAEEQMDGKIIKGLFSEDFLSRHTTVKITPGKDSKKQKPPLSYSADEQKKIEDRLKNLGYL